MDLRSYLEIHRISRAEFARAIGISQAAVSNYIAGRRRPTLSIALNIFHATRKKVTPSELFEHWEKINDPAGDKRHSDPLGSSQSN